MHIVKLRGWDGQSDTGTRETREIAIDSDAHLTHLTLYLEVPKLKSKDRPSITVQWVPSAGWEILVCQIGDEHSVGVTIPDVGRLVVE